ncbi:MAG: MBL fold metallo-hydrolase, partial [Lachnospiraceae bacterium]|nr:MBL fold metallo-hydrolase [Lachnospiraceae bacterium]
MEQRQSMDLTILVDNNTFIDQYYLGEPAVSYLIETDGKKVLFDVGYSDVFLKNMEAMGHKLKEIDAIVLSHGHNDHTGGLSTLLLEKEKFEGKRPTLIAHPGAFEEKQADGLMISSEVSAQQMQSVCDVTLPEGTYPVTENLLFLGGIPRGNCYEAQNPVGTKNTLNGWQADFVEEDTALVYTAQDGIYIITG